MPASVSLWRRLRGAICGVFLLVTAFFGAIFILFPFFPFIFFFPRIWRTCADRLVGFWLSLPVCLMEFVCGVRVEVSGDAVLGDFPAILLMNHRTRLDWLFLWSVLYKIDPWLLVSEKISLKSPLKKAPGAGWAMECNQFIFLERVWERDKDLISNTIRYFAQMQRPYQILFFPEGTDLCEKSLWRSRQYAQENSLPEFEFVLHPRTTGLLHLINQMREQSYLDYVYDITMAYGDEIVQTELDFLAGRCPSRVLCHVKRYKNSELPQERSALVRWLEERWMEKEVVLSRFYAQKPSDRDLVLAHGLPTNSPRCPDAYTGFQLAGICFSFGFWSLTAVVWTYFFFLLHTMRLYFILAILSFVAVERWRGGVDHLVLNRWLAQQ